MIKIAVPVSGTGSNLQAILDYSLPVTLVISDRDCLAIEIARNAGIPTVNLHRTFGPKFNKDAFTLEILKYLWKYDIGLIAMAGFRTILSDFAFDWFPKRFLNLHPSLLPKYKGAHAVRDAIMAGEKVTGCTIHIATAVLDEGPILAQQKVPVLPDDTVETLHERIRIAEWELYPKTIAKYLREIS